MIHVLIVEDDPMVAHLNRKYIESIEGFKVTGEATNGEQAMVFCKKQRVDLIILDIYMPKLDGIEFLKTLRKEFILIDVILVTASKDTETIDIALKLGAIDYLIKPFEYNRLKKSLNNYLKRMEVLNSSKSIIQEDLDKLTYLSEEKLKNTLIKGLHKNTLNMIIEFFKTNEKWEHTSEELAEKLNLSRVTIRRYMEYLESTGEIIMEIQYGTVGRPSHLYRYIKR
ncbi:MAG: response regulator [Clostridiales bacterium]